MTWLLHRKSQSIELKRFRYGHCILIKNRIVSHIKYLTEGQQPPILLLVIFELINKMGLFHLKLQSQSIIRQGAPVTVISVCSKCSKMLRVSTRQEAWWTVLQPLVKESEKVQARIIATRNNHFTAICSRMLISMFVRHKLLMNRSYINLIACPNLLAWCSKPQPLTWWTNQIKMLRLLLEVSVRSHSLDLK